MKQKFHSFCTHVITTIFSYLILTQEAFSALPKVEAPSKGQGTSFYGTMKNYFYDGATFLALGFSCYALFVVGGAVIETFAEVREKKAGWGRLAGMAIVGVVIIIFTIWLVTKAVAVFE